MKIDHSKDKRKEKRKGAKKKSRLLAMTCRSSKFSQGETWLRHPGSEASRHTLPFTIHHSTQKASHVIAVVHHISHCKKKKQSCANNASRIRPGQRKAIFSFTHSPISMGSNLLLGSSPTWVRCQSDQIKSDKGPKIRPALHPSPGRTRACWRGAQWKE